MMQRLSSAVSVDMQITSRANPLVSELAKLSQAKYRREQGRFLAEGIKLCGEASSLPETQYLLVRCDNGYVDEEVLDVVAHAGQHVRIVELSAPAFDKITTENAPQGIIAVIGRMERIHRLVPAINSDAASQAYQGERILALDSVQDPGNLGTILRTAAAFAYDRVLLGNCADVYHPRTVRAAMGAIFRIKLDICESLTDSLHACRRAARRVLAAALTDDSIKLGTDPIAPTDCVVIGNEGHGVSQEICSLADAAVHIPMAPGTESLNAAGAATVLMWEYYRSFFK